MEHTLRTMHNESFIYMIKDIIHEICLLWRDSELYTNRHCFYSILAWFLGQVGRYAMNMPVYTFVNYVDAILISIIKKPTKY